jgi:hypothetical protein
VGQRTLGPPGRRYGLLVCPELLYGIGTAVAFWWYADWTARQTVAVALAGFVLIWYTWETMQLRRAAFAQRQLQLRPLVVLEPQEKGFVLRNVGPGVALNVQVDDVILSKQQEVAIRFPRLLPVLTSGATAPLVAEGLRRGRSVGDFFLSHLDPEYAIMDLRVSVRFQNAEMTPYVVTESINPGELRIAKLSTNETL